MSEATSTQSASETQNGRQSHDTRDRSSLNPPPTTYELQELERELDGIIHFSNLCSKGFWTAFQDGACEELYYRLGYEDGHIRERLIRELRRVAIWHLELADELEQSPIPECSCVGVLTREYRVNYESEDQPPRSVWLCDKCAAKGGVA